MSDQYSLSSFAGAYDVYGPSYGFPLVFLHADALTRKMWQPQIDALSSAFRVVVLDLPGHGALGRYTFRLSMAVEEVARIMAEEVKSQALLVGLSLGGFVAIALAHEHPELLSGLVLSGCSLDTQGMNETLLKLKGTLLSKSAAPLERLVSGVTEKALRRLYPAQAENPLLNAGAYWKGAGEAWQECAGKDFRAMLHTYRGPVLVLNGENDGNSRKSEEALLSSASHENIRVQTLANAGHMCNMDQPRAFNDALRGFTQADMYHSYHYGYQGNKEADERQKYYVEFEAPQSPPMEDMPEE